MTVSLAKPASIIVTMSSWVEAACWSEWDRSRGSAGFFAFRAGSLYAHRLARSNEYPRFVMSVLARLMLKLEALRLHAHSGAGRPACQRGRSSSLGLPGQCPLAVDSRLVHCEVTALRGRGDRSRGQQKAGVTATLGPIPVPSAGGIDLMVLALLSVALTQQRRIVRTEGILLMAIYLGYLIWRVESTGL